MVHRHAHEQTTNTHKFRSLKGIKQVDKDGGSVASMLVVQPEGLRWDPRVHIKCRGVQVAQGHFGIGNWMQEIPKANRE